MPLAPLAGRRVELWVEARDGVPAVNPIMRSTLDELIAAGAEVSVRVPEHEIINPQRFVDEQYAPDLVLLKSAATLALSVAIVGETHGVRFLNGARATLRAHDKAAAVARLAAAGLPVPKTFLLSENSGYGRSTPESREGWVTKPTRGVHGCGVVIHGEFPAALEAPSASHLQAAYIVDDGVRLIQRRIGGGECDLKVYVTGDGLYAGRKRFGPDSYADDGITPVALDSATTAMVRAVGEVLELRLFGVDLRFEQRRPTIIDANPFPGYRGFPDAVPALRAEIERALEVLR